jgi:putative tricarboxylic transport membrane protein
MRDRLRRIAPYALIGAAGVYLYRLALAFDFERVPGRIGPDAWPRMILVLLVAICALQVIRIAVGRLPGETGAARDPLEIADMALLDEPEQSQRRVWIGVGCTLVYVFAFQWIGFLASSFVYLLALMVVGGYRRLLPAVVIALVGSLSFVFVFMKIVYVSLPLGQGPFLAFSAGVMRLLGIH